MSTFKYTCIFKYTYIQLIKFISALSEEIIFKFFKIIRLRLVICTENLFLSIKQDTLDSH